MGNPPENVGHSLTPGDPLAPTWWRAAGGSGLLGWGGVLDTSPGLGAGRGRGPPHPRACPARAWSSSTVVAPCVGAAHTTHTFLQTALKFCRELPISWM
jgi:hypothetical protein